jgi:hypothetical protein
VVVDLTKPRDRYCGVVPVGPNGFDPQEVRRAMQPHYLLR